MPQLNVTPKYVNPPKPGKKYASISVDGVYYSFDPAKIPLHSFQKGVPIDIEYTVSDVNGNTYYNIQRVRAQNNGQGYAGGGGAASSVTFTAPGGGASPPNPNAMSKADWAAKDAHVTRLAIAKSCIESNQTLEVADLWLSWVNQKAAPAHNPQTGELPYDDSPPFEPDPMNDPLPNW